MPDERYGYNEYADLPANAQKKELDKLTRSARAALEEYAVSADSLRRKDKERGAASRALAHQPGNDRYNKRVERAEDAFDTVAESFEKLSQKLDDILLNMTKLFNAMADVASAPRKKTVLQRKERTIGEIEDRKAAIEDRVSDIDRDLLPPTPTDPAISSSQESGAPQGESTVTSTQPAPSSDRADVDAEIRASLRREVENAYNDAETMLRTYEATVDHFLMVSRAADGARLMAKNQPKKKKLVLQAETLDREQSSYREEILEKSDALNKKTVTVSRLYDHLLPLASDRENADWSTEREERMQLLAHSKKKLDARLYTWISADALSPVVVLEDNTPTQITEEAELTETLPMEETMNTCEEKNDQTEVLKNIATLLSDLQDKKEPEMPSVQEQARPTLRIAPVTVDISKAVDKAVDAAFAKFRTAFERRVDDYTSRMAPMFAAPSADMSVLQRGMEKMQAATDAKLAYMMKKIEAIGGTATAEPVMVDISATVEAAMAKVHAAMDEKLDALTEKLATLPTGRSVDTVTMSQSYQLTEKICDDEKFLIEKLTAMLANIKSMNDDLMALTESYFEMTEKQKQIVELQQQTNDLQRYTLREQEGVQVNQKVISTDQVTVIEAQTLIGEKQKEINDRQQNMTDAQKLMLIDQKTLIDAQSQLEDAMKQVNEAQSSLVSKQESILKDNARTIDIQNEIASVQAEILTAQKSVVADQKQLAREQKSINEKQKINNESSVKSAKKPVKKVEKAPEEAAVSESAPEA